MVAVVTVFTLPGEVDAILDYYGGLADYHRDDTWKAAATTHYEFNLMRLVEIARHLGEGRLDGMFVHHDGRIVSGTALGAQIAPRAKNASGSSLRPASTPTWMRSRARRFRRTTGDPGETNASRWNRT